MKKPILTAALGIILAAVSLGAGPADEALAILEDFQAAAGAFTEEQNHSRSPKDTLQAFEDFLTAMETLEPRVRSFGELYGDDWEPSPAEASLFADREEEFTATMEAFAPTFSEALMSLISDPENLQRLSLIMERLEALEALEDLF